ncbi:3-isopropylmalate dehydratase small subunit [Ramlibacter sp.]|uniref:3-isopropylmalate dehydratase small subunit n=1 Tax=Ramlibacter sp. TaxID=1917967 RepID=UPI003D12353D
MQPLKHLEGRAAHLDADNIDTDQVVPARFLRNPRSGGYGGFLFHDLRVAPDGSPRPDFPLNRPENQGAVILVAGANFGCGSSREHAVWSLSDAGFRCVIAASLGDIFTNNCYKNGVLPVRLEDGTIARLLAEQAKGARFAVDLPAQTVTCGDATAHFDIAPFWKECLLEGVDDIDLTLREQARIEAFAREHAARMPWVPLDMAAWQARRA